MSTIGNSGLSFLHCQTWQGGKHSFFIVYKSSSVWWAFCSSYRAVKTWQLDSNWLQNPSLSGTAYSLWGNVEGGCGSLYRSQSKKYLDSNEHQIGWQELLLLKERAFQPISYTTPPQRDKRQSSFYPLEVIVILSEKYLFSLKKKKKCLGLAFFFCENFFFFF